ITNLFAGIYNVTAFDANGCIIPETIVITEPSPTNINSIIENKQILVIIDILGRETKRIKNELLFYIYNDGTVEKKMIIE
ncbi:MAG: hypothetical protein HOC66_00650, partial [Flavobacteriales bacterium]|nr:hypothetical protein [Flavobacteriales bacterium]